MSFMRQLSGGSSSRVRRTAARFFRGRCPLFRVTSLIVGDICSSTWRRRWTRRGMTSSCFFITSFSFKATANRRFSRIPVDVYSSGHISSSTRKFHVGSYSSSSYSSSSSREFVWGVSIFSHLFSILFKVSIKSNTNVLSIYYATIHHCGSFDSFVFIFKDYFCIFLKKISVKYIYMYTIYAVYPYLFLCVYQITNRPKQTKNFLQVFFVKSFRSRVNIQRLVGYIFLFPLVLFLT